ncbi:hypothetical protein BH18ACT9_BH18ACT9_02670 [soil metagenome]
MSGPVRPADAAGRQDFWEGVHDSKDIDEVSWWQSVPELSLGLVDQTGVGRNQPIIDVGAPAGPPSSTTSSSGATAT